MGYAIILKDRTVGVSRVDQVTPTNASLQVNLTGISFSYGSLGSDNTISLSSITLTPSDATQSYRFSSTSNNVSVDPITGKVTLLSGFTGGSVVVTATYGGKNSATTITDLPAVGDETYTDLTISEFSYSGVAASNTSSSAPTLSYSYKKNGTNMTTGATYSFVKVSGEGTVNSNGSVNFGGKNTTTASKSTVVRVTVSVGGLEEIREATVTQAANTLQSITDASYKSTSSKLAGYTVTLNDFDYTLTWSAGSAPASFPTITVTPVSPTTSTTLAAGENTYKLTCSGKSSSNIVITAAKEIASISNATYSGSKEELTAFSGDNPVNIKVTYSDNTSETISVSSVTPNIILPGTKTYQVSYQGKTTNLSVTATSASISTKLAAINSTDFFTPGSTVTRSSEAKGISNDSALTYGEEGTENHTNDSVYLGSVRSQKDRWYFNIKDTSGKKYYWINTPDCYIRVVLFSVVENGIENATSSATAVGNVYYYHVLNAGSQGAIIEYNPTEGGAQSMVISIYDGDTSTQCTEITFK